MEQMGLAQAGLPIDKQGIVGPPWLVGHLLRGGEGKTVGGSHHEALKGVALRVPPRGAGGGGLAGVDVPLLREEQSHVHVKGEQLLQCRLHPGLEPGADDVPLEVSGHAQHQPGVLQGHGLHIPKPGVDGDSGHAALHQAFYFFPDVGSRSHGRKPPKIRNIITRILYQKILSQTSAFPILFYKGGTIRGRWRGGSWNLCFFWRNQPGRRNKHNILCPPGEKRILPIFC